MTSKTEQISQNHIISNYCNVDRGKVNILFVIDWLHEFGGTERHLHQLVKYLDHEKFQCHLIALNGDVEFIHRFFTQFGCNFVPIFLKRIYTPPALIKGLDIFRFIREKNIDIVQTFGMGADNYASIIARLAKTPVVISSRRDMGTYRTGLYSIADRISQQFIHEYISVCERVKEGMQVEGIEKQRITRLYNGIELEKWLEVKPGDVSKREQLGIPKDHFVIGNVSHFRPEKGHLIFFESIRQLAKKIPALTVVALGAPGPYRDEMTRLVQNDPVLKHIVRITHTREIRDYLSVFDVACLTPISNEGFSNAVLEEMASGLPIIATDVGGNAEAVLNGQTGYIIPPGDSAAITGAILKLYENPQMRRSMGENARHRAINAFDIKGMIENYQNYYLGLLKNKSVKL